MNKPIYKILIADDEYWIRENLRTLLDWSDHSFKFMEPACDGKDALAKIESCRPDILITDINMPFISGTELIQTIKERFPKIVTIVLSGYDDFSFVRQALLAGAIDYLLKPITKINLVNVLTKAIDIIHHNKKKEIEEQSVKDKLLVSASLARDREFSMMIANEEFLSLQDKSYQNLLELELDFINFFVILVKMHGLYHLPINNDSPYSLSYEIKEKIGQTVQDEKAIIFNNIFSPNEFIIIINGDKESLNTLCHGLLDKLKSFTSHMTHITFSRQNSILGNVYNAYQEALSTFMFLTYCKQDKIINAEQVANIPIRQRITSEHEKQLLFAIKNKNKQLINQTIFESIGLNSSCKSWVFLEVKQTVDKIIWIITSNIYKNSSALEILSLENLIDLLTNAINTFNISEVCSILEEIINESFTVNEVLKKNNTIKESIDLIANYIDNHYFEDLSLTSLSKMFFVERSYLSRCFKQETGENLMLYIAKKRIERATDLIKQSDMSLAEISFMVGYTDYGYFNRVFRKITGQSPREYRNTYSKI